MDIPFKPVVSSRQQMVMFSEGFKPEDYYARSKDGALFSSWDALIAELVRVCPRGRVAVIPCSSIQLPEVT